MSVGNVAGDGGDVDNPSTTALDHVPFHGLAAEERSVEIYVEDITPLLFGQVTGWTEPRQPGIVHEKVDLAKFFE